MRAYQEDPEIDPISYFFLCNCDAIDSFLRDEEDDDDDNEYENDYDATADDNISMMHPCAPTPNTFSIDSNIAVASTSYAAPTHHHQQAEESIEVQPHVTPHGAPEIQAHSTTTNISSSDPLEATFSLMESADVGYHSPQALFPNGDPVFLPTAVAYRINTSTEGTSNDDPSNEPALLSAPVLSVINDATSESEEVNEPVFTYLIDETIQESGDANEADDQSISAVASLVDETTSEPDDATNENTTNEASDQPIPNVEAFPQRVESWRSAKHKIYVQREQRRRALHQHYYVY